MRFLLRFFVVCTLAGTTLLAQEGGTGWTPTLELRVLSAFPDGARANASGTLRLAKGEPARKTVWSGATLCAVGIGGDEPMPAASAPAIVWKMTGEYLGEQGGRHQVRVTAGFTRFAGRDSSAMTTQTLSLREGDGVVLDALSAPIDSGCPVHTVTLDARLVMQALDPALARARYVADLWLVHTNPEGQEQREHLVMNVDASGPVPFNFNRLAFPLPQLDPRQGDAEAVIRLGGSLRARARTDGLVDVEIETSRMLFGLERSGSPPSSGFMTTRNTLKLKSDETTGIEFPPGRGFSKLALGPTGQAMGRAGVAVAGAPPPAPVNAVEVQGNVLALYPERFFKDHRTQLLVRLRRLP
jgi:hypothetical protein